MFTIPAVADFMAYFVRDFLYDASPFGDLTKVQPSDIQNALNDAGINVNQCFFANQAAFNAAYLNLAAHYMTLNLRSSAQGIGGKFGFLDSSKSVGSVSVSSAIPQSVQENPYLAIFFTTTYGAKYVMMILPQLAGNVGISYGGTSA